MSTLFGDQSIPEAQSINENSIEGEPKESGDAENEAESAVKRPAWLKQKKGSSKKSTKKSNKQNRIANNVIKPKTEGSPIVDKAKPKEEKVKPKEEESDESDASEPDTNENNDRSSEEEVKSSSVEDDDQEWEKLQQKLHKREKVLEGRSKVSHTVHCPLFSSNKQEHWWTYICDRKSHTLLTAPYHITDLIDKEECQLKFTPPTGTKFKCINVVV